ncbi:MULTISPECIES: thiol:disulfide interchange protein DsbA/DsbL [unclassified Pseudoxanthomonas]|jgi:thiol:disulfide interchange protein DsbA|uniref:thiol:disulfide interchange protein DsbA/DsbL n=1 Tax=unclassified Pseudoxanthomonas TaxID=2645906 RepID=UPI003076E4A8
MKSRLLLLLLALLPAIAGAAPAAAPAPVEGKDYVVIPDGKPFAPLNGKVEVVEVFGYTCIHCAHLEPIISAWKRKQPSYVRLTPVPAAFGGYWIPYARAYYAAEVLGVLGKTHADMFKALHERSALPIQNATPDEIASFYAGYGVDSKKFVDTLNGAAVDQRLERARAFVTAAGVEGTPSIIINGKYRVTGGGNYDGMLRIADQLIARERSRGGNAGK